MKRVHQKLDQLKRAITSDPDNLRLKKEYDLELRRWKSMCKHCEDHPVTLVFVKRMTTVNRELLTLHCEVREGQAWPNMFVYIELNSSTSFTARIDRVEGCSVEACSLVFEGEDKVELLEIFEVTKEMIVICNKGQD